MPSSTQKSINTLCILKHFTKTHYIHGFSREKKKAPVHQWIDIYLYREEINSLYIIMVAFFPTLRREKDDHFAFTEREDHPR